MATQTVWVETYLVRNTTWPGTAENPMRPVFCKHPQTGKEMQVHYNDRNLITDNDYKNAGFKFFPGRGWCYPIDIEPLEG